MPALTEISMTVRPEAIALLPGVLIADDVTSPVPLATWHAMRTVESARPDTPAASESEPVELWSGVPMPTRTSLDGPAENRIEHGHQLAGDGLQGRLIVNAARCCSQFAYATAASRDVMLSITEQIASE